MTLSLPGWKEIGVSQPSRSWESVMVFMVSPPSSERAQSPYCPHAKTFFTSFGLMTFSTPSLS